MTERITRTTLKIRQRRDLTTLRVNVDRLSDVGDLVPVLNAWRAVTGRDPLPYLKAALRCYLDRSDIGDF
jgi:hypothetical protein